MKIRTDFVTNSSSSSFVTYKLVDSEFCKYLHEQMQKNGFTYEEYSIPGRPASSVSIDDDELYADISCPRDGLYCDGYLPEVYCGIKDYGGSDKEYDVVSMSENFLDVIGEFVPLEKVDDPEKLYDAFVNDLKNGNFECNVYIGSTD